MPTAPRRRSQQMAHDVTTFLTWASEPNLDERHRMGVKVILFLLVAAGLFYAAKRRIWAKHSLIRLC